MGERLTIYKLEQVYYGTKLFGYVDQSYLKSYKWLEDNHYISKRYHFNPNNSGDIIMRKYKFEEFIEIYKQDLKEYKFWSDEDFAIFDANIKKALEGINDYDNIFIAVE